MHNAAARSIQDDTYEDKATVEDELSADYASIADSDVKRKARNINYEDTTTWFDDNAP